MHTWHPSHNYHLAFTRQIAVQEKDDKDSVLQTCQQLTTLNLQRSEVLIVVCSTRNLQICFSCFLHGPQLIAKQHNLLFCFLRGWSAQNGCFPPTPFPSMALVRWAMPLRLLRLMRPTKVEPNTATYNSAPRLSRPRVQTAPRWGALGSAGRLKQVGVGCETWFSAFGGFPPETFDEHRVPFLPWLAGLLPSHFGAWGAGRRETPRQRRHTHVLKHASEPGRHALELAGDFLSVHLLWVVTLPPSQMNHQKL